MYSSTGFSSNERQEWGAKVETTTTNRTTNRKKATNPIYINRTISIITLSVDGPNTSIKRQRVSEFIKII